MNTKQLLDEILRDIPKNLHIKIISSIEMLSVLTKHDIKDLKISFFIVSLQQKGYSKALIIDTVVNMFDVTKRTAYNYYNKHITQTSCS